MSVQPERPVFTEAQVLAAADLALIVDHAADAQARHQRELHSWGIAAGLDLVPEPVQDARGAFVRVMLSPGLAIDGTGRQIVVSAPLALDEGAFEAVNGTSVTPQNADTWFPVLLSGRDQAPPASGVASVAACGAQAAQTRVAEGFEVSFGRAGDELDLDEQRVPPIDEGPGRPGTAPWRVLLGFVRWNPTLGQFSEVGPAAGNVSVRYAGVVAESVAARQGRVELRSRVTPGRGTPAAVVDEEDGGRMYFGLHDGLGNVSRLLTVSSTGDVTAEGTVRGLLTESGGVLVQSGQATDGTLLPLPAGVTEEQVRRGQVVLHVSVTPRIPAFSGGLVFWMPSECRVDEDRRVHSAALRFGAGLVVVPAGVDYVVMAAAAPGARS